MAMRTKSQAAKAPSLEDLINRNAEDQAQDLKPAPVPVEAEQEETTAEPRVAQKKFLVYLDRELDRAFTQYQYQEKLKGNNVKFQRLVEGLLKDALREYL